MLSVSLSVCHWQATMQSDHASVACVHYLRDNDERCCSIVPETCCQCFCVHNYAEAISDLQDEVDPAFALLYEHVSAADPSVRLHAIMGLAIAYAGTQKEQASLRCNRIEHYTDVFGHGCHELTVQVESPKPNVPRRGCLQVCEHNARSKRRVRLKACVSPEPKTGFSTACCVVGQAFVGVWIPRAGPKLHHTTWPS